MKRFTTLLWLFLAGTAFAQTPLTEHTLALDSLGDRQPVTIDEMSWLAGRWVGEGLGGTVEETWNPPLGGTMVGSFRLVRDDAPSFYELMLLVPDGPALVMKVKHFSPEFEAWEEKADFASFPLIRLEPGKAWFDGLTIVQEPGQLTFYLAFHHKDGTVEETTFRYRRAGD